MTRNKLWNMKLALPRTTILAIGIAAAGLFATPSAFAGPKEIAALNSALNAISPGTTIQTATAAQLSQATLTAIDDLVNKKLSPTVLAGEALKGTTDANFGNVFGSAAFGSGSARIGDKNRFAAGAAVSASTGTTANATQVPAFAAQFFTTNEGALAVAKLATKSNTAIGAILGGRALEVGTAIERVNIANTALVDGKTKKAAQQIAQYVGDAVVDNTEAAAFATSVAVSNKAFVQKIAVGTTTSNPTAANGIVTGLFASSVSANASKIAPKLAKSVGLVADIEQVQLLAVTFGGKVTSKQLVSVAKALVQSISGRLPAATGPNGNINKADEVGEVVAYYLAAVKGNTAAASKFATDKAAVNFAISLAKTMFKAAKVKNIKGVQTPTALQAELIAKPGNFAASFALTFKSLGLPQTAVDLLKLKLADPKILKSIGGKTFGAQLAAQFVAGFDANATPGANPFENGTDFTQSMIDAPETDIRNG